MIHPLFCFYAYYRIFTCRPPVLEGNSDDRHSRHQQESQYEYPPIDRSTVSKVLQPGMNGIPGQRSGQHKAYQQDTDIRFVKHNQNLRHGRPHHLADTYFLSAILAVEYYQTKDTHHRDKDGYQTE